VVTGRVDDRVIAGGNDRPPCVVVRSARHGGAGDRTQAGFRLAIPGAGVVGGFIFRIGPERCRSLLAAEDANGG